MRNGEIYRIIERKINKLQKINRIELEFLRGLLLEIKVKNQRGGNNKASKTLKDYGKH